MTTHTATTRKTVYGLSLLAIGAFGILCPRITPSVAFVAPVRIDIIALAFLGVLTFFAGTERVGRRAGGIGEPTAGTRIWGPQIVVGGLLGAALVAPWAAFPWLVVPALAMVWGGKGGGRPRGYRGSGVATALLAAVTNCAVVAGASSHGLRISPDDFETKDFRANSLLADVPLHDVWAIELKDHPSPTLEDLGTVLKHSSPFQATPTVTGLVVLRGVVGLALGWEDPEWAREGASLVHRLSDADRQRSTTEPGTSLGTWRVLYAFPREGAVETINGTVHVAVAASIGEGPEGARLFLSFRVSEVNWTTPFYMRLIDPARRFFVYPFLLRQFAHAWERSDWTHPEEFLNGEQK